MYCVKLYSIDWKFAGVAYPIVSIPVFKYVIFSILVAKAGNRTNIYVDQMHITFQHQTENKNPKQRKN